MATFAFDVLVCSVKLLHLYVVVDQKPTRRDKGMKTI